MSEFESTQPKSAEKPQMIEVPDWSKTSSPETVETGYEVAESVPLTHTQEKLAVGSIELAIGLEDPSEVDEGRSFFGRGEISAMRAAREAAQRTADQEPGAPDDAVNMSIEQPVTKSPEQAAYDAIKQEMAKLAEDLSDSDKFYLDQYVEAGPTHYDEQAVATTKMSSKLIRDTDRINNYQAAYDRKRRLQGL
jgi:hypothetical protein